MKTPQPSESACQRQVITWFASAHKGLGVPDARLLSASNNGVPLGGGRSALIRGAQMKRHGTRAGWPDLFLAVPQVVQRSWCAGLFVELKRERGGRVSPAQREMHALLRQQGYAVNVAEGFDNAIKLIAEYCRGR